jgi:hypothetical protein
LALPGPLAGAHDEKLLRRLTQQLEQTRGSERDELLEALSASGERQVRAELLRLAQSPDVGDRAKVAELLAADPDVPALSKLTRDADPRVRQNAVWSLGFAAPSDGQAASQLLLGVLGDREVAVVGNAAVSLGRLARARHTAMDASVMPLCGALLQDSRASVREQALRGLALGRLACPDPKPTLSALHDARARVRRAAAELLLIRKPDADERKLLDRCAESDPSANVAEICAGAPRAEAPEIAASTVLVVPNAGGSPTPGAPFGVLWADGGLRLGNADRRGAVHEPRAPQGPTELVPYPGGD